MVCLVGLREPYNFVVSGQVDRNFVFCLLNDAAFDDEFFVFKKFKGLFCFFAFRIKIKYSKANQEIKPWYYFSHFWFSESVGSSSPFAFSIFHNV